MTRRIAITILLTVWSAIIIAGSAAWGVARFVMLRDLDHSVLDKAKNITVRSSGGDATERLAHALQAEPDPDVIARSFISLPDGEYRRLDYRTAKGGTDFKELRTDNFRLTLNVLALSLAGCGLLAGLGAMVMARRLAKIALRPLQHTADVIGEIDESTLDRRIATSKICRSSFNRWRPAATTCWNGLASHSNSAAGSLLTLLTNCGHPSPP